MKLSIITINYNNRDGLRKTIESVVNQTYRDFEYVVIDGGSTDGSVEVIKEYADKIDYWVSEKDRGIYHAMNKGALAAHGEYTLFLNSGDWLVNDDVFQRLFSEELYADIVSCSLLSDHGRVMPSPHRVTFEFFIRGTLPHPSTLIRRSLFTEHLYDEKYRISADWEFFMYVLIKMNATYQSVPFPLSVFDTTGISSTQGMDDQEKRLLKKAFSEMIPERVMQDYDIYMGRNDNYHKLFHTLQYSEKRRWIYSIVVLLLKTISFNRGWIREYPLCLNLN